MDEVVPGDIVTLATGDMIPADAILIWTKDLFINQSSLTGESMPVEKFVDAGIKESDEQIFCTRYARSCFHGYRCLKWSREKPLF